MSAIHLKPIVTDAEIFQKEENQNNKEIIVKGIWIKCWIKEMNVLGVIN